MRMVLLSLAVLVISPHHVRACQPDIYYLFKQEARAELNSVLADSSRGNDFAAFILLHNLAFHKDKHARERAEKLSQRLPGEYTLQSAPDDISVR